MPSENESRWATRDYHYFRDHEQSGAWGVAHYNGTVVAIGLDKADALMLALFLDGKTAEAEEVRLSRSRPV